MSKEEKFRKQIKKVYHLLLLLFSLFLIAGVMLVYYTINPDFFTFKTKTETIVSIPIEGDEDSIENGIHIRTGLIEAEGLMTVVNNCTNCHSSKIILQNRMNTERWNTTIKWMQETQNLWGLGKNQEIIVNYLVTNYPVKDKGRRDNLSNIDWYELEN
ncbi:monoheme cytochrome C [Changchengzhania lutea]|uniref:monoheme cytochrome C n=1 Tax=Changchengzhania lutea TaxID=2049305 RepID=UPI00115D5976|nr:monoheme cytochrome C [Changchengzhania lutea]